MFPLWTEQDRQFTCQLDSRCAKMAWLGVFYYVYATLFAQLAITLRLVTPSGYTTLTPCLSHAQGVRRDGEEPLDRLLPVFYEFRTGCFRDSWFGLLRVASWYDLWPCPLKQSRNPNFGSAGTSKPPFR